MKSKCHNCRLIINRKPSYLKKVLQPACSRLCANAIKSAWLKENQFRDKNPAWKGGIRQRNGYIQLLQPSHPFCDNKGYVFEHRLIVEKKIGRYLNPKEIVHHKNGIKTDNRPSNLEIMKQSAHMSMHIKEYWKEKRQRHLTTHPVKSPPR
jgi:hypothetical protein